MEDGGNPVEINIHIFEEQYTLVGYGWKTGVFALQFGDRQIEVVATQDDRAVAHWIQDVQRAHRERLRRGRCAGGSRDLVVGLCSFQGRSRFRSKKKQRAATTPDEDPLWAISLCADGTHCLLVLVDDSNSRRYRFFLSPPRPLAAFLADRRNSFVGIGIREAVERLNRSWGIQVAKATDLRSLVAGAFGTQAVPPLKGGGGDADGLRRMARVALKGIDAGEKPADIEFDERFSAMDAEENILYAAVDSFLTCEVAEACLHASKA